MLRPSRRFTLARHILPAVLSLSGLTLGNAASADERFIPRDMHACDAAHAAAGFELPCKQPLSAETVAACSSGRLRGAPLLSERESGHGLNTWVNV